MASDLRRAAATAAELSAVSGLPVAHDAALRETYAGAWQGLTHEEIIERYGEQYAAWKRGEPVRRGGGELETEVADRAAPVVLEHADKLLENGTLVVVSHGGTIRTTIGRLLGLEAHHWEGLGGLSNCCWSVLGGRTGLAPAGAQRRHAAGAGARRRRLRGLRRIRIGSPRTTAARCRDGPTDGCSSGVEARLAGRRRAGPAGFRIPAGRRLEFFLFAGRKRRERSGQRGYSSVGRAPAWHAGGQEFNSP